MVFPPPYGWRFFVKGGGKTYGYRLIYTFSTAFYHSEMASSELAEDVFKQNSMKNCIELHLLHLHHFQDDFRTDSRNGSKKTKHLENLRVYLALPKVRFFRERPFQVSWENKGKPETVQFENRTFGGPGEDLR